MACAVWDGFSVVALFISRKLDWYKMGIKNSSAVDLLLLSVFLLTVKMIFKDDRLHRLQEIKNNILLKTK